MSTQSSDMRIFSCSPRRGGNTDAATEILAEVLKASGAAAELVSLRDYKTLPCLGCNYCAVPGNPCVLAARDDCACLLGSLLTAKAVFWLAPIYFYHLPAQSKGLIDRAQYYWYLRRKETPEIMALPPRKAHVLLIAARSRGENLFQGSLATLRYFFEPFNVTLGETLLMTGLEGPLDLRNSEEVRAKVVAWAKTTLERQES